MNALIAILRKEINSTFHVFSIYLILGFFALISGFFFFANLVDFHAVSNQFLDHSSDMVSLPMNFTQAVITPFFMNLSLILLLMIPLITMKSFSEERKLGTFELLLTYPVSDFQIVAAKFLNLAIILCLMLLPPGILFTVFFHVKGGVDVAVFLVAYVGVFLFGFMMISLGMLMSSLTDSQVVSAVATFLILMVFWVIGWISDWIHPGLSRWIKELWVVENMRDLTRGVLDTKHIAFFVVTTCFFFFMTIVSLESRTWKK
ncbi:MAG: hypothetical protein COV74_04685 [Candidatus Omnitrophica bacterium CG11_big_fil_rev_8_21_14_0_20_45_26]|uniref:ABC transporter permease n=1 Tax=Candidatus Abzuiibacterium crystallinum TaxID=1974748 RepID=A0A2H0LQ49_9BACT|nr:MAG: hypothetical protein COV74_04685 [Candidatus Omnitrophica bacterium CG11_big_fil_rev_8_21_14_0_20_45_26]PIW64059.1 MAG: hypothetical protein COW12_07810 [Candidatus Omnitrophica bacterium CG12_big_fil_rev_8_21_14_0_65_45_16]